MGHTEFANFFRVLRASANETLSDAKKFLSVSEAFISSVEKGKRPVPEDWYDKIVDHYNLDAEHQEQLKTLILSTRKEVKVNIESATETQKRVSIQIAKSLKNLDDKVAKEILGLLKKKTK